LAGGAGISCEAGIEIAKYQLRQLGLEDYSLQEHAVRIANG
jgi:NAD-dependent SIR2 family protein deacetylase